MDRGRGGGGGTAADPGSAAATDTRVTRLYKTTAVANKALQGTLGDGIDYGEQSVSMLSFDSELDATLTEDEASSIVFDFDPSSAVEPKKRGRNPSAKTKTIPTKRGGGKKRRATGGQYNDDDDDDDDTTMTAVDLPPQQAPKKKRKKDAGEGGDSSEEEEWMKILRDLEAKEAGEKHESAATFFKEAGDDAEGSFGAFLEEELLGGGGSDGEGQEKKSKKTAAAAAAAAKKKKKKRKKEAAAPPDMDAETAILAIANDYIVPVDGTLDAQKLLNRLCAYLDERTLKRLKEIDIAKKLIEDSAEDLNTLHSTVNAYVTACKPLFKEKDLHGKFTDMLGSFNMALRANKALQRAQYSCALEVKRLCLVVENLTHITLTTHDHRRMPGSMIPLITPIYEPVQMPAGCQAEALGDNIARRVAPPPIPTAAGVEYALDREKKHVRVVKADTTRREQSFLPSKRSSLVTESLSRRFWCPRDTADAHRLTRARVSADAIAQRRVRRMSLSTSNAKPLRVISAPVNKDRFVPAQIQN